MNDMSVVQTPSSSEYNFQYKPDSDNSPVPLKDIDGDAYEDGVRLSIKGKITKGANVEVVGYKRLKMFTNLSYDANFVVKSLKVSCLLQVFSCFIRGLLAEYSLNNKLRNYYL